MGGQISGRQTCCCRLSSLAALGQLSGFCTAGALPLSPTGIKTPASLVSLGKELPYKMISRSLKSPWLDAYIFWNFLQDINCHLLFLLKAVVTISAWVANLEEEEGRVGFVWEHFGSIPNFPASLSHSFPVSKMKLFHGLVPPYL